MPSLDDHFELSARGTTVAAEVRGGLTTFLAMAYIVFVQPAMLSAAGMDAGAVLAATCITSAFASLVMGLWANHPVALAPGMGLNAFFAFTVCGAMAVPWQEALGLVFLSGLLFLALGGLGLRERIVTLVPEHLQHAIAAGIGFFIVFLGLKESGLLVPDPNTFVSAAGLEHRWPLVATAFSGLLVGAVLLVQRRPGGVLGAIATAFGVGLVLQVTRLDGFVAAPPSLAPTAGQLSLANLFTAERMGLVLLFLYTDLFDTVGTLVGVSTRAGLMRDGQLPRAGRAFASDALGTTVGALLGTSTVTSYIESAAGVQAGARTGLSSVVVAALFLACLVLHPLVGAVGAGVPVETTLFTSGGPATHTLYLHPVTAPALLLVGALMASSLRHVDWDEPLQALPSMAVVAGIPLTFSIADGMSLGLIAASLLSLVAGRRLSPLLHGVALLLLLRWVGAALGWV